MHLLKDSGISRDTGRNTPIILDRTETILMVERGHVDLFTVRLRDGRPEGARFPFCTVPTGDILLGTGPKDGMGDHRIIGIGSVGTIVCEIDIREFFRLASLPSMVDEIQRLMRRWIRNASLAIGRNEIMPRHSKDLGGEGRMTIHAGNSIHPTFKTIWVRVESGGLSFMGRHDLPEIRDDRPFPLVRGAWLRVQEETVLSFCEEWPSPEGDELGSALRWFGTFVLACSIANIRKVEDCRRDRMRRRQEMQHALLQRGVARLASISDSTRVSVDAETERRLPLFAACRVVGQAAGISVRSSGTGLSENDSAESLEEISRSSGFRTRRVRLRELWWRRDNGPLLVYHATDGRPLAAIPESGKRYELVDPVEGTVVPVDRTTAASLDDTAHVFYRPFPATPIRGPDLIRFGVRGSRRDISMALVVGLCGALLGLLIPWFTGFLIDTIITEGESGQLIRLGGILFVGALAILLFNVTHGIALLRIESRADGSVQAALWDRLLTLPVTFFSKPPAGDLAERSMGFDAIRSILADTVIVTVLASLFSLVNVGLMFHYSPNLALIVVCVNMVGLAVVLSIGLFLLHHRKRAVELEGKNSGIVFQLLTGITKIRITGSENGAFSLWADSFSEKRKHEFRAGGIENILDSFEAMFPIITLMVLFFMATREPAAGLSTGIFVAFMVAVIALQNALLQAGSAIILSLDIIPIYDRMRPILKTPSEVDERREKPGILGGRVVVHHLTFRYDPDGPLILNDVSLRVEPGEFVAIVGGSGSGKSTLLRLLLGFTSPAAGAIYYDGKDLASLDVQEVRHQIGVVLQNGHLMPGDIRTSIVGSSMLSDEDAWEAARLVGLDQDIREMPMGMYTMVPAGGGTLSGGQRQRILIARAIVRKPRILFFDEATSALDNRTQAMVSRSLEALQVTRVVIAHRLSTIMNADRIYVLDRGEIVEQGSYAECMDARGLFYELAGRQII